MGLFSSKTTVSVASTLYNMAGDEANRPDFLKGSLVQGVLGSSSSIVDNINQNYFNGPAMNQRQFFRYADRNDIPGLVSTNISGNIEIDISLVEAQIPEPGTVFLAQINKGDFIPWVEKWILSNHPTRINEDWISDYNPNTSTFSIEFPNNDFFAWNNDGSFGLVYGLNKEFIIAKYIKASDSSNEIFFYERNTGNIVLDSLFVSVDSSSFQEFFPFMPIRINNESITDPKYTEAYQETRKAYSKAFQGKKFDDLIDIVEDNENINDIDYAYLCFGVSLNTKENACKKYVYKFFEKSRVFQNTNSNQIISSFQSVIDQYNADKAAYSAWVQEGANGESPTYPTITIPPVSTIQIKDSTFGFDYRVSWINCEISQEAGNFHNETGQENLAKKDSCTMIDGSSFSFEIYSNSDFPETITIPSMIIYWQDQNNSYKKMTIWGLVSENFIYGGNAVKISSSEALADIEESGFLIPLHYPTFKEMGLKDATQMSTANSHIMFNSYLVVKQKWYQRSFFKILIVILAITIGVVFAPGTFASGTGLLGNNAILGASLGFTGTVAIIVGTIANYIAAILFTEIISIVGTTLFGEEFGALFSAVVGLAIGASISGIEIWSTEGLMNLTSSIANGYQGWVENEINEMSGELGSESKSYEKRMREIDALINNLNNNDLNFNPVFLTDWNQSNVRSSSKGYVPESSDQYIRRTTMTGSDIVDLTLSMVYDYVDIARTLPRN